RESRVCGVVVHVLGRRVPDVLKEARLNGPAPHVLVNGERVGLSGLDGQLVALGILNGLVPRERQVTHRSNALEVRSDGGDAHLKAHLVVSLTGATVRNRGRVKLTG